MPTYLKLPPDPQPQISSAPPVSSTGTTEEKVEEIDTVLMASFWMTVAIFIMAVISKIVK